MWTGDDVELRVVVEWERAEEVEAPKTHRWDTGAAHLPPTQTPVVPILPSQLEPGIF